MKIEVAESLMRSWLRHVKGCQFAELNWKASSSWAEYHNSQQLMDSARAYFERSLGKDVFGGTKTAAQLVKQGEVDVLGIKLDEQGVTERLYGVDIAFHEGGLNYRDVGETVVRVTKKIIRSIMIVHTYFGQVPSEFIFASPRVGNSFLVPLQGKPISNIKQFLVEQEISCHVGSLVNEAFRAKVLDPTLQRSSGTADSSELFLRSYRLLRLLEAKEPTTETPAESESAHGDRYQWIEKIGRRHLTDQLGASRQRRI